MPIQDRDYYRERHGRHSPRRSSRGNKSPWKLIGAILFIALAGAGLLIFSPIGEKISNETFQSIRLDVQERADSVNDWTGNVFEDSYAKGYNDSRHRTCALKEQSESQVFTPDEYDSLRDERSESALGVRDFSEHEERYIDGFMKAEQEVGISYWADGYLLVTIPEKDWCETTIVVIPIPTPTYEQEQQAYEDGYTDSIKYNCEYLKTVLRGEVSGTRASSLLEEKKNSGAEKSHSSSHYYSGWKEGEDYSTGAIWMGILDC